MLTLPDPDGPDGDPRTLVPAPDSEPRFPDTDPPRHPLIVVADGRRLDTPGRVLGLALAIREHSRVRAGVLCVVREDPEARLGRGRLWVGPTRPGAGTAQRSLTTALLTAMLHRFGLQTTCLRPDGATMPDPASIKELLAEGTIVVVSDRGGGHVHLAAALGATETVFGPDSADHLTDRRVSAPARRSAAAGGG